MSIAFLLDRFKKNGATDAIIWRDEVYSYRWLLNHTQRWINWLTEKEVLAGTVVALEADFSPNAIALMLALIERRCVVVPLTVSVDVLKPEFRRIAQVEALITVGQDDRASPKKTSICADHELLLQLKRSGHPGLVLFTSGSTGQSKAVVHDFVPFLEKFKIPRYAKRTITFLLFDHLGGIDTLLYTLSNAGCVVTLADRSPDTVCKTIEKHRVEVLPVSPTFMNLLLLSHAETRYDLSSLEIVTYGTEVMPENTLGRFRKRFPNVRLLQKYGLSEVGTLRSKSKSSDSVWVKVGGEGFETRVVGGMLEIRARSAMLGYLNAPSPFTEDGWFRTGDAVEVGEEYIRILGRQSEIINVGGQKVYPAEVEGVLQLMPGVSEAIVGAESNPITGQIVKAQVRLMTHENIGEFRKRMRQFCKDKLTPYQVPQKVAFVDETMYSGRFKKMRL